MEPIRPLGLPLDSNIQSSPIPESQAQRTPRISSAMPRPIGPARSDNRVHICGGAGSLFTPSPMDISSIAALSLTTASPPSRFTVAPVMDTRLIEYKKALNIIKTNAANRKLTVHNINDLAIKANAYAESIPREHYQRRLLNLLQFQLETSGAPIESIRSTLENIASALTKCQGPEQICMEMKLINLFREHVVSSPIKSYPDESKESHFQEKLNATLIPIYRTLTDFSITIKVHGDTIQHDLISLVSWIGYHYFLVPLSLKHNPTEPTPLTDCYIKFAQEPSVSKESALFHKIIRLIFNINI